MGCNCGKKTTSARPVSQRTTTAPRAGSARTAPRPSAPVSAPGPRGKVSLKSRARNVRDTMVVSDEEKERRLVICRDCPHFRHKTTRCGQCGCFLNIKAKLAVVSCPIGQW